MDGKCERWPDGHACQQDYDCQSAYCDGSVCTCIPAGESSVGSGFEGECCGDVYFSTCCGLPDQACLFHEDCCDGFCTDGAFCCRGPGGTCAADAECCSENCTASGSCCQEHDGPCSTNDDCCVGHCSATGACCKATGDTCTTADECCGGCENGECCAGLGGTCGEGIGACCAGSYCGLPFPYIENKCVAD